MEICSFWCGSLSPQLPDSACFFVSAACFSLAGHMIRRSGQSLSSSPYPSVHPRRSLFPREVSGSLYPRSLPAHSFYSFLAPCLSEPSEPHKQDQREQRYVPPPPQFHRVGAAVRCPLPWGLAPRGAVLCHAVRLGGSCGPRQLAVRGCPVQFARLIAQKCSEATSVEGKLGSSIVFILAPPGRVSSLILAVV